MRPSLVVGLVCLLSLVAALTSRASDPAPASAATEASGIAGVAFLAGTWHSDDPASGFNEETWSAPHARNMVGCFRWLKPDGTPSLFELLCISEEDATLKLRLRHHNAALEGWKAEVENNKPLELVLKEVAGSKVIFHAAEGSTRNNGVASILYERKDNTLHIEIAFADPKRQALSFNLTRSE